MIGKAIPDTLDRLSSSHPGHGSAQLGSADSPEAPSHATESGARGGSLRRELVLGFLYWLAFLLLLEPGNLVAVVRGGIPLTWVEEALRIGGAGLLGAMTTPILLGLTRRLPIEGPAWRRRAAVHAASIAGLSAVLIVVAQILAALLLPGRDPRLQGSLEQQLAANGALLVLAMTTFTAMAHAARYFHHAETGRSLLAAALNRTEAAPLTRIPVKTRGGVLLLPLDEVDWIETQGNYLALHAGPKVHLIRETLARFESRLDPQRFVRIHRRTIVRADRVRELMHLSNGDASIRLLDGTDLRVSRGYGVPAQLAFSTKLPLRPPVPV